MSPGSSTDFGPTLVTWSEMLKLSAIGYTDRFESIWYVTALALLCTMLTRKI